MRPAYRLFYASPLLVNFDVYTIIFGKLKSGTVLTSVSTTFLPYDWDFENIFAKTNHIFTSPQDLSCRSLCIYPHQGIASFHPTSKDSLCGAHGRWKWKHALASHILQNQTMDPCRWQIIRVDQDCARVEVDGGNEILLLWISLPFMRTWLYYFFSLDLVCPNIFFFFGSCFLGCHLFSLLSFFFLFFWIAHASFGRY